MDKTTVDNLTNKALILETYFRLPEKDYKYFWEILGQAERRALTILMAIKKESLTFEEIGEITGTHPTTVRQTLSALRKGGFTFLVTETGKWQTSKGGRKRRLVSVVDED